MKTALKAAITTSISEVLETMFFMNLEFNDKASIERDVLQDNENVFACRIGFNGKFSGYFLLLVPDNILFEMTESFMGIDRSDITEEESGGTIKEAINMLAGSSLSGFDDTLVFNLSIPEIIDVDKALASVKETEEEVNIVMNTAEGYMALKAIIESG